jgi:hypothetical protein
MATLVRFKVLTAASMKLRVFWDVAPCNHVEVDRLFRGVYCLRHRPDDGVHTSETTVNFNVTTRRCIPTFAIEMHCLQCFPDHIGTPGVGKN